MAADKLTSSNKNIDEELIIMTKKFSWENFDYEFLREIVYHHKTPLENRPTAPVKEKERLAVYVEGISLPGQGC